MYNKNEITVFRSLDLIEKRILEKLTVENIANSVYFSKCHYQRLFREIVGESVMEYVTKRKLTLAGKKLLETEMPILEIALEFGYNSHENFTRSFKTYMGVTPSEYRKYGLAGIFQMKFKEKHIMSNLNYSVYSKNTNEIIRELNEFIAQAKETVEDARKTAQKHQHMSFWNTIADKTDAYTNRIKKIMKHVTGIAKEPDEINNRFAIIKVIEDIAFESNLTAFNVGLLVARNPPEVNIHNLPLCEKYRELAKISSIKAGKVASFLNELSVLIFADMRKAASDKIQALIKTGEEAVDSIKGYSYIKDEVANVLIQFKEQKNEEITISFLEEMAFKMYIISFAADMDIYRMPSDKEMFDGLMTFRDSIIETTEFFKTLIISPVSESEHNTELSTNKRFTDIAYHGNVLLFYTRGEISYEKLGSFLNDEQKAAFEKICDKLNNFIQYTLSLTDKSDCKKIIDMLYEVHSDMVKESDKLNEKGGCILFLANEFKHLADSIIHFMK